MGSNFSTNGYTCLGGQFGVSLHPKLEICGFRKDFQMWGSVLCSPVFTHPLQKPFEKGLVIIFCLGEKTWCEFIFQATSGLNDHHKNFILTNGVPYLSNGEISPTTLSHLVFGRPHCWQSERYDLLTEPPFPVPPCKEWAKPDHTGGSGFKDGQEESLTFKNVASIHVTIRPATK